MKAKRKTIIVAAALALALAAYGCDSSEGVAAQYNGRAHVVNSDWLMHDVSRFVGASVQPSSINCIDTGEHVANCEISAYDHSASVSVDVTEDPDTHDTTWHWETATGPTPLQYHQIS